MTEAMPRLLLLPPRHHDNALIAYRPEGGSWECVAAAVILPHIAEAKLRLRVVKLSMLRSFAY